MVQKVILHESAVCLFFVRMAGGYKSMQWYEFSPSFPPFFVF